MKKPKPTTWQGILEEVIDSEIMPLIRMMVVGKFTQIFEVVKEHQSSRTVPITGVHLWTEGDDIAVSVESNGNWTRIIREHCPTDHAISHICEVGGIKSAVEVED